ncbi:hypothetical protein PGT21_027569 [Puccinia graminis f. sp. tritici]|uniref:Uncharacterized protein n=1 Tax=Puccinia graminis f. sp. tritici TaxID=56615 RepID=A0A5B0NZA9_PUCGR|nr:hypothetical protein PGT21_027569 [Puccinia graminis f. sp. tritici]
MQAPVPLPWSLRAPGLSASLALTSEARGHISPVPMLHNWPSSIESNVPRKHRTLQPRCQLTAGKDMPPYSEAPTLSNIIF